MKKKMKNNSEKGKMFSWMNPKLEVREGEKYGKGVFANQDIGKDEILAIFGGYILTIEEEAKLPEKYKDGGVQIHENYVLSSKDHIEPTDYFNHTCEPNAGFNGQIFLVSMKEINKDDEISFDYAMCLFSRGEKDYYSFPCKCGNEKCRGSVTSDDWKTEELQAKYKGYFQRFLEDKIN